MSYKISQGISESELPSWLASALKRYGRYDNGGVNYKNAPLAPIILCVVACSDEFLLVQRGYGLADAEGYWSVITGYIDTDKPVAEIASNELSEEIGLELAASKIKVAQSYTLENPQEKRRYIIFPCLARIKSKPTIKLDRENVDYAWIKRSNLESYHILDDLPYAIDLALALG